MSPRDNTAGGPAPDSGPYRLGGLELASGLVLGYDDAVPPLGRSLSGRSPRQTLEDLLAQCLRRPPCVVQFSGGRDSSAVLALTAHVARKHDLPLPIPATVVFPGMSETDETQWQELVIRHVGLPDWERLEFTDEMDLLGPIAIGLLLDHGPTYPSNGHFVQPMVELARGGTMLTGVGGDELFDLTPVSRLALALTRRVPLRQNDLKTLALISAPKKLRVAWYGRRDLELDWLQPEAQRSVGRDAARWVADTPLWWADDVVAWWRSRPRRAIVQTLRAFCVAGDVEILHPLQEGEFLASLGARFRRTAWTGRAAAMDDLFGDVLPQEVTHRDTKAIFSDAFFGPYSREFAEKWSGEGVDRRLVDPARLRQAWLNSEADARSGSALQGAWAAVNRNDVPASFF
jgi:asparagine synthetase B (glutamine-hydrolysing)